MRHIRKQVADDLDACIRRVNLRIKLGDAAASKMGISSAELDRLVDEHLKSSEISFLRQILESKPLPERLRAFCAATIAGVGRLFHRALRALIRLCPGLEGETKF